jgi:chromosome segregation ATPase
VPDVVQQQAVPEVPGQIEKGTLKAAEETEEVETLPEDAEDEKEIEIELGKKLEEMAYRIEEMEKKMQKMEEAMMPPVDQTVNEEVAMEEEELPKLDGAPIEEAVKFSADLNRKNYGKKSKDSQSSFLSRLYK